MKTQGQIKAKKIDRALNYAIRVLNLQFKDHFEYLKLFKYIYESKDCNINDKNDVVTQVSIYNVYNK